MPYLDNFRNNKAWGEDYSNIKSKGNCCFSVEKEVLLLNNLQRGLVIQSR